MTATIRSLEMSLVAAFLLLGEEERSEESTLSSLLTSAQIREVSLGLPPELGRVLMLPNRLRQCFVLRILLGWPVDECAHFLGVDTDEIDQNTCLAAQALARIANALC